MVIKICSALIVGTILTIMGEMAPEPQGVPYFILAALISIHALVMIIRNWGKF